MEILEYMFDNRSECFSILTSMTLKEYKDIVFDSFEQGGNLEGQRDVIKRSSVASKIRKRMNNDFIAGAIFPHVVLGVLLDSSQFEKLKGNPNIFFKPEQYSSDCISIIDGMQRSNIYFSNYDGNEDRDIRVEFWVSNRTVKLLYRMLVLNTGQVPWNTRRQVEVIFSGLSKNIMKRICEKNPDLADMIEINGIDDDKRRRQPGKFKKSLMIELYLGFNTRKAKVDVNDELADEFQRFDMMESIEKDTNFELFIDAFSSLCKLDFALSNCNGSAENGQYKEGKDIFGSIPACIGFVVAYAEYVMGKVPIERSEQVKTEKNEKLQNQIVKILSILEENKENDFLALDSLNEVIKSQSKSKIGDEMRNSFKYIFSELLKYDELEEITSLEAFWRALI